MDKNILRLLITEKCDRSCKGCCNSGYNVESLKVVKAKELKQFDEVLITGGEPLHDLHKLQESLDFILANKNKDCKVYLYTARPNLILLHLLVENMIDGVTLTLHNKRDEEVFQMFNLLIKNLPLSGKSLRLNVIKGTDFFSRSYPIWDIKEDIEWIEDCPLPENEIFMRYE